MTALSTTSISSRALSRVKKPQPATPTALLVEINAEDPTMTREERRDVWVGAMMTPRNANLLRDFLEAMFPLLDSKLQPRKPRKSVTPRQRIIRKKAIAAKVAEMQKIGARHFMTVGYMECPMPNGKAFGDCTIGEVRKMAPDIGGLVSIIANLKGPAKAIIRKTYTNAQLAKLAA
jgi:hypothetical protein